jgi:hypothetical protein
MTTAFLSSFAGAVEATLAKAGSDGRFVDVHPAVV